MGHDSSKPVFLIALKCPSVYDVSPVCDHTAELVSLSEASSARTLVVPDDVDG